MNKQHCTVLGVTLGLMGLAAMALAQMSGAQRLGNPGLRLIPQPTYVTGGGIIRTQSVKLPEKVDGFTSKPVEISTIENNWLPKDTLFGRRAYQDTDGFSAQLSVVLMGADRTSIHKPQFCLDGQGWHIEKTETAVVRIPRPYAYDLKVMKLTTSPRPLFDNEGKQHLARAIYVYWFVAEDKLTPFHGQRMWWMAQDLIRTGVLERWAYVSYFTLCLPGTEEATFARVKKLIAASVPEFQLVAGERLARAGDGRMLSAKAEAGADPVPGSFRDLLNDSKSAQ